MNFKTEKFQKYTEAIIKYNKIHMLTGFKTPEAIEQRLYEESLEAFKEIDLDKKSLLDIGTGAGIPGVPLKINNETIKLTLLETMQKRIKFLLQIKDFVEFDLIAGRAEEEYKNYIENFDVVTMRAVSKININLELAVQYAKVGGLIVLIKGPKAYEEINRAKKTEEMLNLKFIRTYEYKNNNSTTVVVIYKKEKSCEEQYPRVYGIIKNKPLGE